MKYPEPILQFFEYAHLPARLQEVSHPFASLAHFVVDGLPRNPERSVALRKLLETVLNGELAVSVAENGDIQFQATEAGLESARKLIEQAGGTV